MNELDPHLAALLRRAPEAPSALDAAHRQAVLLAARQAWFRQRARSRRNLLGLAAAAVFAAAIAGWTIRSLVDSPVQAAPPAVAAAERPAERKDLRPVDAPATMAKSTAGPAAAPPAPLVAAAPAAPAPLAAAAAMEADGATNAMRREAGAADARMRPAAAMAPAAMAADMAAAPSPQGHLVVAQLVLEAARGTRLTPATRQATLQAALDGLAGIDGPEAEALRAALRQTMQPR